MEFMYEDSKSGLYSQYLSHKPLITRWCERGDSNPHPLRDQILSLARLPIPPLSQRLFDYTRCRRRAAYRTSRALLGEPSPRFHVPEST